MFHEDAGDPQSRRLSVGEILARAPGQLARTSATFGTRLDSTEPDGTTSWLAGLGLLSVALVALRRREPSEWFCLALLGVVALYFAFIPGSCSRSSS